MLSLQRKVRCRSSSWPPWVAVFIAVFTLVVSTFFGCGVKRFEPSDRGARVKVEELHGGDRRREGSSGGWRGPFRGERFLFGDADWRPFGSDCGALRGAIGLGLRAAKVESVRQARRGISGT